MSGLNTPTYKLTKNAGDYKHKISIYQVVEGKDSQGFPVETKTLVLQPYASIKTTRGMTIIANNSDFEKALTNFTIRYSDTIVKRYDATNRNLIIKFHGRHYTIEYLNNIDEANVELEMQAKMVKK